METLPGRAGAAAAQEGGARSLRGPISASPTEAGGEGAGPAGPLTALPRFCRNGGREGVSTGVSSQTFVSTHTPFESVAPDALKRTFPPRSRCEAQDKPGAGSPWPGCRGHGRRPSGRVPAGALVPGPSAPHALHLPAGLSS